MTLQRIFFQHSINCNGIDMLNLSIDDIRRSKLIYLLSPENEEYFDMDMISVAFNIKNDTSFFWLKKVAKQKYK
jgi:hypothetical protein